MNKPVRVLLASPSHDGQYHARFLQSLTETIFLCAENNIELSPCYICYDSLIERVRNKYLEIAYQQKFDVLFFIDSDISWLPEDFVKLVLSDRDMIGGAYRKKHDEEELYTFKVLRDENENLNLLPDKNGILEVLGFGCGFMKLSKKCVEALFDSEKNFYYLEAFDGLKLIKNVFSCSVTDGNYLISEDITAGVKWRAIGGKAYIDTKIKLSHSGNKNYIGDVGKWLTDWDLKIKNQKEKENLNKKDIIEDYIPSHQINTNSLDDIFKIL